MVETCSAVSSGDAVLSLMDAIPPKDADNRIRRQGARERVSKGARERKDRDFRATGDVNREHVGRRP
jgi:hypothetical protein